MTTRGRVAFCFVVCLVCVTAVNANADSFTLTGPNLTINFSLPGMVTNPGIVTSLFSGNGTISGFSGFEIDNVLITLNGSSMLENIEFFTDGSGGTFANGGGLAIGVFDGVTLDLINQSGSQLFNINTLKNPFSATFRPGTFGLTSSPGLGTITDDLTLTITPEAPPIPEPSTILLFGSGLVGFIGAVRRKLRV